VFKWLSVFFDSNEKELKKLQPAVDRINELEPEFQALSDVELRDKTGEFRKRIQDGAELDELLPEAFAAVREASRRTLKLCHYDVQLIGGIILHQGKIAEMRTGEGKTLVATLPLYLNSLTGKGCHLVTVNDYLARRDPYWMGPVYNALGVRVASIYPQQNPDEHTPSRLYDPEYDSGESRWKHFRPVTRREAYEADITYGTSSEFGFDQLRDNMLMDLKKFVQQPPNFAVVDEVDNLLIDEARTPLIISGPAAESSQSYQVFARLVPRLNKEEDYTVDEKTRTVNLTEEGMVKVENMLSREGLLKSPNLYAPQNHGLTRYLENSLKAHVIFNRDRDYVVKDGEVLIVDEFTGRLMFGRRYSEGLHQAIEAKEHVKVQRETMTFATITIQNYFRMYNKLSGMTGTALTEAEEFHKIYNLEVVVVPTNKPMVREDFPDQIYKDEKAKFRAVVREIEEYHKAGRPVLIGTVSIEKSEYLSDMLMKRGIPYEVLNANKHEKEANIIARAGEPGMVTVATNMAGRGVDIILGGSPDGQSEQEWRKTHEKVLASGGLHIIGTDRHEARRIDNQLRGRAGRQGDSGSTRFYLSLEDDIVRRFGGDRIKGFMNWVGMDEDTPIENALVSKTIADVQKRVEGYHFDMRKHLVEYDDVINKHRELIYGERRKILEEVDLKANILSMIGEEIEDMVASRLADEHGINWDLDGLVADVGTIFPLPQGFNKETLSGIKPAQVTEKLSQMSEARYAEVEKEVGAETMRMVERVVMLRIIDNLWIEHLTAMENMRMQAQWQTMRQVKAVDAYKNEGYKQFRILLDTIRHDMSHAIFHVEFKKKETSQHELSPMAKAAGQGSVTQKQRLKADGKKIGRNDPCPCGSGKKYKHCCGR